MILLAGLVLSSCALPAESDRTGTGGEDVPEYLRGLPFEEERDLDESVSLDTEVLPVSPCALHDPRAAAELSGFTEDSLEPGPKLNECALRVSDYENGRSSWVFGIDVGRDFAGGLREDTQLVLMEDTRFYRTISKSDGMVTTCSYYRDLVRGRAIALDVRFSGYVEDEEREREIRSHTCEIGKKYLRRTARRWIDPPRRDENMTEPALLLGMRSPCVAMKWAMDNVPPVGGRVSSTRVHRFDPSNCTLEDKGGTGGAVESRVSVDFVVTDLPENLRGRDEYEPVDVMGRPGFSVRPRDECEITFPFRKDPYGIDVNVRYPDSEVLAQSIKVTTSTCENSKRFAEALLEKLQS
ncbi:hypothetical protein CEP50_10280 [Actinopolyspora mortivallis]|uniref:DUF3558 domain-containing protein n=1 Tax=Actinopolyspora mortivallis TaxID=33906 RepID=A0A2T0GWG8_ACTMO|nr:hypothetical protein CEP50_10280 [Actinopolyspora mortivallis]